MFEQYIESYITTDNLAIFIFTHLSISSDKLKKQYRMNFDLLNKWI